MVMDFFIFIFSCKHIPEKFFFLEKDILSCFLENMNISQFSWFISYFCSKAPNFQLIADMQLKHVQNYLTVSWTDVRIN